MIDEKIKPVKTYRFPEPQYIKLRFALGFIAAIAMGVSYCHSVIL